MADSKAADVAKQTKVDGLQRQVAEHKREASALRRQVALLDERLVRAHATLLGSMQPCHPPLHRSIHMLFCESH